MEIVNRVAESDLTVFDLGALWDDAPVAELDIAPWLHRGFVLREKDFRAAAAAHDWSAYADQHVAVYCSTDALVPPWAWMLVTAKLREAGARRVTVGREADLRREHFAEALAAHDFEAYRDRIAMVKGCGAATVPPSAYADAMRRLMTVARKVMYGEPCSSVPLWRRSEVKGPKSEKVKPSVSNL
ncbi:MAG TPA: DUF2480 family protein [Rhodothermales bacterium]|nr:DUF2480 family protein [Rhodothermales bacterium]